MSMPPPAEGEPVRQGAVLELAEPPGGLKRLVGRPGPRSLTLSAAHLVIEHPAVLRAPLELAPGGIAVATVDPGPSRVDGPGGRFPILRRLSPTAVVPREEGIEGWLWTSTGGSAYTLIADEGSAPNVALVFLKPLEADVIEQVFHAAVVEDLAKRSPMGSPTVFGVLLCVAKPEVARTHLNRLGLVRALTDREVPPTQRRHLPTDRPANPTFSRAAEEERARTSIPPPGMG